MYVISITLEFPAYFQFYNSLQYRSSSDEMEFIDSFESKLAYAQKTAWSNLFCSPPSNGIFTQIPFILIKLRHLTIARETVCVN